MQSIKNGILICLLILAQTFQTNAQVQKMALKGAPQNLTGLFSFIQEKFKRHIKIKAGKIAEMKETPDFICSYRQAIHP